MDNTKILTIIKGEEFKLHLKERIEKEEIFYDKYLSAAGMLDDIVGGSEDEKQADWSKVETENNIIAFCGERGEGKSSAMTTFINALCKRDDWDRIPIFDGCENVKKTIFSRPIFIDPSTFDDVHNILEVIVASLYSKFHDRYESDNRIFDDYKREKMLDEFQKVYRMISLINNPKKMLEEEFDGETNITNLARMGESTELKKELKSLIKIYLDCMLTESGSKKLLIAIDDLDLCNANAYKMAEQIRKYLIIPDVVIIMALKVEQLQMCVQEENFRNYSNILRGGEIPSEFYAEVRNMAEKYITKLIPRSRRIYLPNVRYILNAKIQYRSRKGNIIYEDKIANSLNDSLLNLIYEKTGMKFLLGLNDASWLQANNLRDTVNMITLLGNMRKPVNDQEYYDNIEIFAEYIEKEWIPQNYTLPKAHELQNLLKLPYFQMNSEVLYLLRDEYGKTEKKYEVAMQNYSLESSSCFFWVRKWLDNYKNSVYDRDAEKFAYVFHVLYTIYLNELLRSEQYRGLSQALGGYIWGIDFDVMLPSTMVDKKWLNRSRFYLPTVEVYNLIREVLERRLGYRSEMLVENRNRISKIPESDSQRKHKILTWLLLGLLTNTYRTDNNGIMHSLTLTYSTDSVIFQNYVLLRNLHVCIENYIVGLCNLEQLYYKVNLEVLGIDLNAYKEIFGEVENDNADKIKAFRTIFTNIDLISEFYNYCYRNRETKESGEKDEHGKTVTAVDRFFRNAEHFLYDYLKIRIEGKLNELLVKDRDGRIKIINISELYADLFMKYQEVLAADERRQEIIVSQEEIQLKQNLLKELEKTLENPLSDGLLEKTKKVAGFIKTKSAQNIKKNLDNLVHNIRKYKSENPETAELNTERLRNYYSRILDIYVKNPEERVPDEFVTEYAEIVKQYSELIKE